MSALPLPLASPASRQRVLAVVLRDLYALRHSTMRVVEIIYWPLVELVIWGYVSLYLQANKVPAVVAALLGGVLLWQVMFRSQGEVSIAFMEDVWSRNLLNVFASPLTNAEYLTGMIVFGFAKLLAATTLMAGLAFAFYGFGLFSLGPALVPFLGLLLVMGWALGVFTVGVVLRYGHSAEIVAWALSFAFQPFAAVFYPVAILPGPMRALAAFVPASHVFEGMRSVIAGRGVDTGALAAAAALDLLYLVAAIWFFRRMLVAARRSGGLARFAD
jgi:ABC-2 type transport system permease protein